MISAEVILDSISKEGHKLTTMKLRYPRFIHSEFMTHRVFSRNASSSRALPVAKLLEEVRSDTLRAEPEYWGAEQKGMQAGGHLDPVATAVAKANWHNAAMEAADSAERLIKVGLHKSICNRLLEPFSHINVVVSATEYANFDGLRLHKDAEPTMRALAVAMWNARQASTPNPLDPGLWHLPFIISGDDDLAAMKYADEHGILDFLDVLLCVSVARCARVSYQSFETGKRSTVEEDMKLYERLVGAQPLHASPAEHQATPDEQVTERVIMGHGEYEDRTKWLQPHQHGNFKGWRQYRQMLKGQAVAPLPEGY